MFESAIEKIAGFTRSIHTISRTYGGLIIPGSSSFFFINDQGVAITCKHVANMIPTAEKINQHFIEFKQERDRLPKDGRYHKYLNGLEIKYRYGKETTIQQKHNFLNCFDSLEQIICHVHPTADLAIIEFKGFEKLLYQGHAIFLKDSSRIKQGKYLCRFGFPFPEFNNFKHNAVTDDIEWTNSGNPHSPSFPIDGIVTRFTTDRPGGEISGIEMSTPGLRGQSGGPLFDTEGHILGMQFATNHLHLGFDVQDKEILNEGRKTKVSNYPFLHVGLCIHVEVIKAFLQQHNIQYTETN